MVRVRDRIGLVVGLRIGLGLGLGLGVRILQAIYCYGVNYTTPQTLCGVRVTIFYIVLYCIVCKKQSG